MDPFTLEAVRAGIPGVRVVFARFVDPTPAPVEGLVLTIAGVNRSSIYRSASLNITDDLNARNTCDFQLVDVDNSVNLAIGEEVIITYDELKIFAGTIEEVVENFPGTFSDVTKFIGVTCIDFNQIADRHLIANNYDAPNQKMGEVVSRIISDYLQADGIHEGVIEEGSNLGKATYNYTKVSDALSNIAEMIGFMWYIDYDKRLHFRSRIGTTAPVNLSDTSHDYMKLSLRRSRDNYRNIQYLRGGTEISENKRTETIGGDGGRRNFPVSQAIGSQPQVYVSILGLTGAYIQQTVGIKNQEEGKQWYWQSGSASITQDSSEPVLEGPVQDFSNPDYVRVVYNPIIPIIMGGTDHEQIAARQAVEGGSGIYEAIEDDSRISDSDLAFMRISGLLDRHANIPEIVDVMMDLTGLQQVFRSGEIQRIDLTKFGLAGDYLIDSVSLTDRGDSELRYDYTALSGNSLGSWTDWFRKLARSGQEFVVSETETLLRFSSLGEVITIADNLPTPDTSNTLGSFTKDISTVGIISSGTGVVYPSVGSRVGSKYVDYEMNYANVVLESSPDAYYKLDEQAGTFVDDSSGFANQGTATDVTLGVPGAISTQFDSFAIRYHEARSDYFPRLSLPYTLFNDTGDCTISFWARIAGDYSSTEITWLSGAKDPTELENIRLYAQLSTVGTGDHQADIKIAYYDTTLAAETTVSWTEIGNGEPLAELGDGAWHHFAFIRYYTPPTITGLTESQSFGFMFDGIDYGQATKNASGGDVAMGVMEIAADALLIGQAQNFPSTPAYIDKAYTGDLDELVIYRYAAKLTDLRQQSDYVSNMYYAGTIIAPVGFPTYTSL